MSETYITSDTHGFHQNIVFGVSTWDPKDGCRPFDTIEEMNEAMAANINAIVKEDDILWHLGDWSFGKEDNIAEFRSMINCKNIHLILGNHDWKIRKKADKYVGDVFKTINKNLTKRLGGVLFELNHKPLMSWENHSSGGCHLHGHCHGRMRNPDYLKRKALDVGLDNHPEFRPFHVEEVIKIMESKITCNDVDYH